MIDAELFGPGDFVMVRAALVREIGLLDAVVVGRVHYRAREEYREAYQHDGHWWWRAPHDLLAEECGLSAKQVRASLDRLRLEGHVIAEQHGRGGVHDRAFSYRVPESGSPYAQEGRSDVPRRADVLIPQDVTQEGNPPTPLSEAEEEFERVWAAWPKKDAKKDAKRRWLGLSAAKRREVLPLLLQHAEAHRLHTDPQYVKGLAAWLNGERWNDPLPQPRSQAGRPTPTDRAQEAMARMLAPGPVPGLPSMLGETH